MYRSQDKTYLKKMYDTLKASVPAHDFSTVWDTFLKQTYLEDLNVYFRALTTEPIDYYRGNVSSKTVIVIESLRDEHLFLVDFIKNLIKNINLDYNNFYVTSLLKHSSISQAQAADALSRELDVLKPEQVFLLSQDLNIFSIIQLKPYISSSFIVNPDHIAFIEQIKKAVGPSDAELNLAQQYRIEIWDKLKNLMMYQ